MVKDFVSSQVSAYRITYVNSYLATLRLLFIKGFEISKRHCTQMYVKSRNNRKQIVGLREV